MRIRKTNGGGWVMEHRGVEAPFEVRRHSTGRFTVTDVETERSIIERAPSEEAEVAALIHFTEEPLRLLRERLQRAVA